MKRWQPRVELTRQEQFLMKRLTRTKKLFSFLRTYRHELFDDGLQAELEAMYRDGGGKEPVAPALMAMATLLQGYVGASDAEAVELTVVDLRWQLVLDRLRASEPAFSQGALHDFRHRLISHDMDRRLLERTAEIARRSGGFDPKKLPNALRVAIDSAPLEGAGRVEDTFNLLGHAARKVVECIASLIDWKVEAICKKAGIPLLLESSIKKGLDVDWSDPEQKRAALERLVEQLDNLERWIEKNLPAFSDEPLLRDSLDVLRQLRAQDLEPDPDGGGTPRIRQGVAVDRRVSVEDSAMRHGRKTKSKRFNGFKRHIGVDIDSRAILACDVTPANRAEHTAAMPIADDLKRQSLEVHGLYVDRGYIESDLVAQVLARRGEVVCRPWIARNGELFAKGDFHIDMRARTITCPAGQVQPIVPGTVVRFDADQCGLCPLRQWCTAAADKGRTVSIADDEQLQHRLRKLIVTPSGRAKLRKRVCVEHRLAHVVAKQGKRARYRGTRNNLFDLRRASSVVNLELAHANVLPIAA
jgi:hypothetical protein